MITNPAPLHPGMVLSEVYMTEMSLNQTALAKLCQCSPRKINEIVNGKRGISPSFAIVLESTIGTTAEMWVRMQAEYDLWEARSKAAQYVAAAKRFFKRLLRSYGREPRKIVTDKLRSYGVVHRELIPETIHSTMQYENNRAEQSHEATRVRERGMWWSDISKFKSVKQAQKFLGAHAAVSNLFNLGRHLVRAAHYRNLRISAFAEWGRAVA